MSRTVVPALLGVVFFVGCREQSKSSEPIANQAAGTIALDGKIIEVQRSKSAQKSVEDVQRTFRTERKTKRVVGAPYAVMTPAEVDHFVAAKNAVVAITGGGPTTELPLESDGALRVASAGMTVAARPLGVARKTAEFAQKIAVYGGIAEGTTLYRRADRSGAEDFYRVTAPRDRVSYSYDVALTNVAGLRLVGGSLELLDKGGAPRLATAAPTVIDAKGVRRTGTLAVRGCAYDSDASGPWGRPVTAPGKDHCEVVFDVDTRGLAFPVLVDPAWFTTANMKQTRAWHQLLQLPASAKDGGKILAVGGTGSSPVVTMLYDVATGTWANSTSLATAQGEGTNAVVFSDGTVLIAGGFDATGAAMAGAQLRDKTTGAWSAAAAMGARAHFAAGIIKVGGKEQAIVAGGYTSSSKTTDKAEIYDPVTDNWTNVAAAMSSQRGKVAGAVLTDGRFLVAGGEVAGSFSATAVASAQAYNPATGAWESAGTLTDARSSNVLIALPGGKAIVAGGGDGSDFTQFDSVEFFSGTAWTAPKVALSETKQDAVAALLSDGRVLVAGGWFSDPVSSDDITTAGADLIDLGATPPSTIKVVTTGSMVSARHSGAALSLGLKVLVSGGFSEHGTTGIAEMTATEIYDGSIGKLCATGCATGLTCTDGVCCKSATCPTGQVCNAPGFEGICTKPKGATCASNSECGTGYCVSGICCASACNSECMTCNDPSKPGECVTAAAGTDPTGSCFFSGDSVGCGEVCDSFGFCGDYVAEGTKCGDSATDGGTASFCEAFACDGFGSCEKSSPTCGLDCVVTADCTEATKTCTPTVTKPGKCAIEGKCYEFGDVSPTDPCKICDPVTDKFTWSESSDCIDGGIVDTGIADTGSEDTGVVDTGSSEDTGVVDTGTEVDATTDTGSSGPGDLPEGQACSCDVPGADTHGAPFAAIGVALGLAIATRRRRK